MNFLFRAIQFGFMHIWPALVLFFSAVVLTPHDVGTIALLMSVATLFRPLVGLSLGRTAIRYSGEGFAEGGRARMEQILNLAAKLGLILSLLGVAGAVAAVAGMNRVYELDASSRTLLMGVIFIYFYGITEFFDGILRASGEFKALAVSILLSRMLGIGLFLCVLPFIPDIDVMLGFMAFAEAAGVALLARKIIRMLKAPAIPHLPFVSAEAWQLIRYSLPVIINALSVYFYARAMVMIAGLYDSTINIGGFEMAVQATNLPMAVTIVCSTVLSPAVARLVASGGDGHKRAEDVVSYGAAFSVWVNGLATVYFLLVGPFVFLWVFPDQPLAAVILAILAPLIAAKAYAQILSGEISIAAGAAGTAAQITLVFGVLTVAAGAFMSAWMGVQGAAIAMLVTHTGAVIASVVILQRKTRLFLRYRSKATLLTALIVAVPTAAVTLPLRDQPALAALAGTAVFVLTALLVLAAAFKYKLSMAEPLRDGLRMLKSKDAGKAIEYDDLKAVHPDMGQNPASFRRALVDLAARRSPAGVAFWLEGRGEAGAIPLQDHADIVYTFAMLDMADQIPADAAEKYAAHLADLRLFARAEGKLPASGKPVNAHLTAYLLAAVRLLEQHGKLVPPPALYTGWQLDQLIDKRKVPLWPWPWTHHIWRVSHWIGGIPSILLHLAHSGHVKWATEDLVQEVLSASEKHIIDVRTGLLRPYRVQLIQNIFRALYRLRHDPDLGDLGGVVHILWVYHALGRPYAGADALRLAAERELARNRPFMEDVPYCLDFDVIQLERTVVDEAPAEVKARAAEFVDDTVAFFCKPVASTYSLHKIPGALASIHECAWLTGEARVRGIDVPRIDIIKRAYWL